MDKVSLHLKMNIQMLISWLTCFVHIVDFAIWLDVRDVIGNDPIGNHWGYTSSSEPDMVLKKHLAIWPFNGGANAKAKWQPLAEVNRSAFLPWSQGFPSSAF